MTKAQQGIMPQVLLSLYMGICLGLALDSTLAFGFAGGWLLLRFLPLLFTQNPNLFTQHPNLGFGLMGVAGYGFSVLWSLFDWPLSVFLTFQGLFLGFSLAWGWTWLRTYLVQKKPRWQGFLWGTELLLPMLLLWWSLSPHREGRRNFPKDWVSYWTLLGHDGETFWFIMLFPLGVLALYIGLRQHGGVALGWFSKWTLGVFFLTLVFLYTIFPQPPQVEAPLPPPLQSLNQPPPPPQPPPPKPVALVRFDQALQGSGSKVWHYRSQVFYNLDATLKNLQETTSENLLWNKQPSGQLLYIEAGEVPPQASTNLQLQRIFLLEKIPLPSLIQPWSLDELLCSDPKVIRAYTTRSAALGIWVDGLTLNRRSEFKALPSPPAPYEFFPSELKKLTIQWVSQRQDQKIKAVVAWMNQELIFQGDAKGELDAEFCRGKMFSALITQAQPWSAGTLGWSLWACTWLKELGIDSRLASGYKVAAEKYLDRGEFLLLEQQYSWWPEVFQKGSGWCPVEFHPVQVMNSAPPPPEHDLQVKIAERLEASSVKKAPVLNLKVVVLGLWVLLGYLILRGGAVVLCLDGGLQKPYQLGWSLWACAWLKELGIDSRLASGYKVATEKYLDRREFLLLEQQYSWWPEVFQKGSGWCPVEFPPVQVMNSAPPPPEHDLQVKIAERLEASSLKKAPVLKLKVAVIGLWVLLGYLILRGGAVVLCLDGGLQKPYQRRFLVSLQEMLKLEGLSRNYGESWTLFAQRCSLSSPLGPIYAQGISAHLEDPLQKTEFLITMRLQMTCLYIFGRQHPLLLIGFVLVPKSLLSRILP